MLCSYESCGNGTERLVGDGDGDFDRLVGFEGESDWLVTIDYLLLESLGYDCFCHWSGVQL